MVALRQFLQARDPGEDDQQASEMSNLDKLATYFRNPDFDSVQPQQPEPVRQPEIVKTHIDSEAEPNLLGQSNETFDVLVGRFHELEAQMAETAARAKAEAGAVKQLKMLASGMKVQAERSDVEFDAMKTRLESAEARAAKAEVRLAALHEAYENAQDEAVKAENLISDFEKIIVTFKNGRQAQRTEGPVASVTPTDTKAPCHPRQPSWSTFGVPSRPAQRVGET